MLDAYLDYIQEGYILSDKTISVNLDQFESGKKKKLVIVGVPGSGKTTLGDYLAKKYKATLVSDTSWQEFLKGLKGNKRTIIEGAGLAVLYMKDPTWRKLLIDKPMILIGMSAIKAGLRADKRDSTLPGKAKEFSDIFYFVRNNLSYFQQAVGMMRKDAMNIPKAKIKEFKVPKFKPVYY